MKISFLLIMVTVLNAYATSIFSQNVTMSVDMQNVTMREVVGEIEKQGGISFLFNDNLAELNQEVSVSFTDQPIKDVLENALSQADMTYEEIQDNFVVLLSKPDHLKQQDITVTGQVTDADTGESLPGVSIVIEGTTTGTVTDIEGKFSISVQNEDAVLVFSFVGYSTSRIPLEGRSALEIALIPEAIDLDEIVVVGYGTQRRANLTGSVSQITGDELMNTPAAGTIESMQGLMPGTSITRSSGDPGRENFDIQIRGFSSVNESRALIIIDGIEGRLEDLRPEDIESVSVLKDASAASIYGAKAAGGVILVTTKRGQEGPLQVEFNSYITQSRIARRPPHMDSWDRGIAKRLAYNNAGISSGITDEVLDRLRDPNDLWDINPVNPNEFFYYGNYDYFDMVMDETTPIQSHNLNVSGGTEATRYRVSGTYYNNQGMIKIAEDSHEQYTAAVSLDSRINDYMSLQTNIRYSKNVQNKAGGRARYDIASPMDRQFSLMWELWIRPGVAPLYDPNGNLTGGHYHGSWDCRHKFGEFVTEAGTRIYNDDNLRLNATFTVENFVEGLRFRFIGVEDQRQYNHKVSRTRIPDFGVDGAPTGRWIMGGSDMRRDEIRRNFREYQVLGDYNVTLADQHSIFLLGGYSFQESESDNLTMNATGHVHPSITSFNWVTPASQNITDRTRANTFQSFFGRINYSFRDRYLLEGNLRYDGTSKLPPDSRYGLFPSASAGWRITQEDWFNIDVVSEFKPRISWGQLGNAGVLGDYAYISNLSVRDDAILSFDEVRALMVYESVLASDRITWEIVETMNYGIDLGFLNQRLAITFDYFFKSNKNMLARVEYPSVIGISTPNANVGEFKSWGWETNVIWRNTTRGWYYWINANLANVENELVEYMGANVISASARTGLNRLLVGYPLNTLWGYESDGLFQTQEEVDNHAFQHPNTGPGDPKYVDQDGDGVITMGDGTPESPGDLVYLGDTSPRYTFGVQTGFTKNAFDFSMFIQGVGRRLFELHEKIRQPYSSVHENLHGGQTDYWATDNPDAYWPRPYQAGRHQIDASDYFLQNGAFARLKELTIGYTVPTEVVDRVGIAKFRIYLAGRDLWEITKTLDFIDPEQPQQRHGHSTMIYPFRRHFSAGVNLVF